MEDINVKPAKRKDLYVRTLDDEFVIYDAANRKIHKLNETSRHVWELCDGSHSLSDIAKSMTERFDVGYDQAGRDVIEIVGQFRTNGLLM